MSKEVDGLQLLKTLLVADMPDQGTTYKAIANVTNTSNLESQLIVEQ